MRYISLFSGIEAASVAWDPLGWETVAFAEIEPFPCAVLAERFPNVPNLGSVIDTDWSDYHGAVDVIVGGSPCQSFSIAGRREGLQGESRLMFEYIRAVREVRPRYFIWENVPGAFTSDKGEAFRQLLSEMDDLGYGMAWRVLDAQFSEWPSDAAVCSLSESLETGAVPQKYFLSPTACAGILSRAERRGKALPPQLKEALEEVTRSR